MKTTSEERASWKSKKSKARVTDLIDDLEEALNEIQAARDQSDNKYIASIHRLLDELRTINSQQGRVIGDLSRKNENLRFQLELLERTHALCDDRGGEGKS